MSDGSLILPPLCLGLMRLPAWGLDGTGIRNLVTECLALGVDTFDLADIYGDYECESLFGNALAGDAHLRDKIRVISKCGIRLLSKKRPEHRIKHYDSSHRHIVASVESSLRRLRTDRLDLLLLHRPDPLMDAEETAEAFDRLRRDGKVHHFGVSNFTPAQAALLASRLPFPLATNQIEFSPLHLTPLGDGTLDWCQRQKLRPMVWSPLAGGRLLHGTDDRSAKVREALDRIGRKSGDLSVSQVALAWIWRHPIKPCIVVGTGKTERIRESVRARSVELDRQHWFEILKAATGRDVP